MGGSNPLEDTVRDPSETVLVFNFGLRDGHPEELRTAPFKADLNMITALGGRCWPALQKSSPEARSTAMAATVGWPPGGVSWNSPRVVSSQRLPARQGSTSLRPRGMTGGACLKKTQ